ncbi:MAG: hypothetical protein H6713_20480 [Myxococcales bacterium]|nr:hypothetical protein [Myxococcales bacterium]
MLIPRPGPARAEGARRATRGDRRGIRFNNALFVRGDRGFRLWWSDLFILGLTVPLALATWSTPLRPGVAIATVVAHYFLFCNITRMRGLFELLWALSYSALSVWLVGSGLLTWPGMTAVILPLTISLTIAEVTSPRYRGVGSRGYLRKRT